MGSSVGERLRSIRKQLALKQAEMAAHMFMSVKGWQLLETPKAAPSAQTLTKLTELGFSADWILTGQGSMRFDDGVLLEAGQELGTEFNPYVQAIESFKNKDPKPSETSQSPHEAMRETVTVTGTDPELMVRTTGMVESVYRINGINLSMSDVIRIGVPYYDRLRAISVTGTEDERLALLSLLKAWLEKDISTTASSSNNSKASA
ncbi:helix-turn-helix transcriptional regulator [Microvirga sp. W0021]|uniref:Helix-turn-helix transcriptional regulator n=1 Tax=Hohaiivirga grylli TaxID=3133970 RepID=A0ABV0BHX4_9HYPH